MFDYDCEKIINCPNTIERERKRERDIYIYIYIHAKMHISTNIHNTNIQSYTIQTSGPILLDFSAINEPTEQNTVDYIGHQLETY